jgi:CubicO group peptidase (beta-lactamase class C family)
MRLTVLSLMVCSACQTTSTSLEQRIARIETELDVPGVSVAVINDGEIEWARGYGMADVERQRPVTTTTLFQAASISKPVAAMAALQLVERGALDLDEDVNQKLTSWQLPDNAFTANNKVTLRGLVTHTAGTTVWGFPGYARGEAVPSTVDVLDGRGNTDSIRVYKEPGESWRYSGGGYTIMQLLLHDVLDKPFPELMHEMVLEPAGMASSTYEQPLPVGRREEAASGYDGDGRKIEGDWHTYPEMAAAGLWTTPSDLARFAIEIQRAYAGESGALIDQATARQMLTPGMEDWGLGPVVQGDGARFGHGGSNEGFRAQFTAFIEEGAGVAVMTNSDNGGRLAQEVILTVAREYGWPGIEPEMKDIVTLEPDQYRAVEGRYALDEVGEVELTFTDGRLLAHLPTDDPPLELLPESATEFFARNDGTPIRFEMEDGRVTTIVVAGSIRGAKVR